MGILAAVAVPKFFSMQEDAKIAALNGGLSEAAARFNHAFSKYILVAKKAPSDVTGILDTTEYLGTGASGAGTEIGDFIVTWKKSGPEGLVIDILTAKTIGDTALGSMPTSTKSKTVSGITWGTN